MRAAKKDQDFLQRRQDKEAMRTALFDNVKALYEGWDGKELGTLTSGHVRKP